MEIEFTDRYKATGKPYPDPDTMCEGQCEGMGLYPQRISELNRAACEAKSGRLTIIGQKEKDGLPCKEDEYVFVECPDCKGTGRKWLNPLKVGQ